MDPELLRLKERIEIALELGESHYREFKTALEGPPGAKKARDLKEICNDISKTLVAFANADGGELFVGIEDNSNVSGIPFTEEKLNAILKAPETYVIKETPLPIKKASIIDYEGIKVAFFSVEKGSKYVHLTSKGECFQRKDRESVPTASETIRFLREEAISREFDRQFTELAKVNDLDLELVERVSKYIAKSMSPEKFLQYLELAEFDGTRLRLRKAALLLFAKNVNKWHARSQVRILKVKGTEEKTGEDFNILELAEVNGNIFTLIEEAWEALRPHLTETRFSKDAIFRTQIIYPELACKEALVNAIVHRDYSIEGRGIEIRVFDDRLEILSPGKLLSSITIKDIEELKGVHQTRNAYIGRVLREFGYIRELGEGIRRMFDLMKSNELVPPKIESPNKSFIVTLFYRHIYTKEEKIWLNNFDSFELSREQKTVVRLGIDGRLISPREIWESVGIVDTEYYRQLLEGLMKKGILKREIDKPKAIAIARNEGKAVKSVPQFQIVTPGMESAPKISRSNYQVEMLDKSDYSKIYVTNLNYSVTVNDLMNFFNQYGEVLDVVIPKDFHSGKPRGFAFVEFETNESVVKILNDKRPKFILGRRIFIQEYKRF